MKKLIHLLVLSAFVAGSSPAQNDLQFTHFMFNKLSYNPGYTGSKGAFDASAIYRNQWSGIDGAPVTMNIIAHTPFPATNSALGLSLSVDEIGKYRTATAEMSYAYRLKLGGSHVLSLGLMGRMEQVRINWASADPLDTGDTAIPVGDETTFTPNFGGGAYLTGKNYFAGISAPRFLKNGLYNDRSSPENNASTRTYYFMTGMINNLSGNIQLLPSLLISYNPAAPVDFDLNANLRFFDTFWIGGSYRLQDSFDAMVGYEFGNGLRLGIAADFTTSELQRYTKGSYELMIGYTFKCKSCEVSHLRFF